MNSQNEHNSAFLRDLLIFFLTFAMLFGVAIAGFAALASILGSLL
jgi:hypothetical protein